MKTLNLLLILIVLSSCVSVKIGDQAAKKSTRYSYENPSKDFTRIKDEAVDVAWLSQQTAATLSVKSKCSKNLELDLEDWLAELVSNFRSSEIVSTNKFRFNKRKAIRGVITTPIEGYENKLAITSFVKNSCQYIIVLTSPVATFDKDETTYNTFLESFKAW